MSAWGRTMRVLVVDDDLDLREAYADCLRDEGCQVLVAEHGLRALEMAHSDVPDVILMDLALPVMDGWEATRILKRDERTRAIPVIAITGESLKTSDDDARSAGCDAVIHKPCGRSELLEAVRKFAH
ncbi:MAG: response regulator [Myxococcota bacterium]|nr:response regulator [Myxococcota bacterium]